MEIGTALAPAQASQLRVSANEINRTSPSDQEELETPQARPVQQTSESPQVNTNEPPPRPPSESDTAETRPDSQTTTDLATSALDLRQEERAQSRTTEQEQLRERFITDNEEPAQIVDTSA